VAAAVRIAPARAEAVAALAAAGSVAVEEDGVAEDAVVAADGDSGVWRQTRKFGCEHDEYDQS
jgi:hypothetical protein